MADKSIFIADDPKKGQVPRSPFDLTFTNNNTGKFGQVQCVMMKYYPAGTKLRIKPSFVYDLMPLVYPIQTNVRCHVELYKVPLRILCDNWEDFVSQLGTNGTPVNSGGTPYVLPYIKRSPGWNSKGSLAEQLNVSNQKLESVIDFSRLQLHRSYGGIVNTTPKIFCRSYDMSSHFFAQIDYLDNMLPVKSGRNNFNTYTFGLTSYLTSNFLPSNLTGTITVHLCLPLMARPFINVHASISGETAYVMKSFSITGTHQSAASFNNNPNNALFVNPNLTLFKVNNNDAYSLQMVVKIEDDSFYSLFASYRAAGLRPFVLLEFSDALKDVVAPQSGNASDFSLETTENVVPTEVKPDDGQVSVQYQRRTFKSSLGLLSSVFVNVDIISSGIHTFYDSVDGAEPLQPVSALPFRAMEFIHNYFKRKPRIDPFIKDGVPSYNQFLTNTGMGADSTTPVDTWNAFYEDDYFTDCVKEPQFGNAPLVGVTVNDTSDKGILRFSSGSNPAQNYSVEVPIGEDGAVMPPSVYHGATADRPNLHTLRELIAFGISINDLRNVSTFQRMLERMQRSVQAGGSPYKNYMYEFFGTNPPIGDHYPQYLGGVTRNISVDKITNVALSKDAPLGEFAGQARISGEGKTIKTFLTEPSYIVAIQYFTVTPVYSQYAPKHMFYSDPLDFYLDPDFATISPQPVYKKELDISHLTPETLNDVFGYNRPYAELVSNVDEVHGNFRTDMANYLLQRLFGSAPNLNKSFIEIDPNDMLNIFSNVENTDKIFGQCMFEIHGSLPMPRSYVPHTI